MKIEYLKNAPLGAIGEVHDVADDQAKILITLGFAKALDDNSNGNEPNNDLFAKDTLQEPKPKRPRAKKTDND